MKVNIGPYKSWFGPYQLADLLQKVGVSEETCYKIGSYLSTKAWIKDLCLWLDREKSRKVLVEIHPYDTWNMNDTLALIILPMLQQLQRTTHGAPYVDDEDVPEPLRSTSAPPKENEWDTDENHFKRWDWILDEMIWGFSEMNTDWESQFYSGEVDFLFEKQENSILLEMKQGPGHTFDVDQEGLKKHSQRIDNSLRLFGKYYRNLWD
jgi:hypothetical protein